MEVTLLAKTQIVHPEYKQRIPDGISELEFMAVLAGKFCTDRQGKLLTNENIVKFIERNIKKLKHESLLEHWSATFIVEGVSRALTHQLVRHRIASYHQVSQRYTGCFPADDVTQDCVWPASLSLGNQACARYWEGLKACKEAYQDLVAMGVPKEDARFVVPNAHKSTIWVTWNARTCLHVLNLRLFKPGAQWEIKEMMEQIHNILMNESKVIFKEDK